MTEGFIVIVSLGDSLTAGYRSHDPYAIDMNVPYPAKLESYFRSWLKDTGNPNQVFVVNAGVNGDSTEGMIWRFNQDVTSEKPDMVVIWAGINDLSAGREPAEVFKNLKILYQKCAEINAKPVACTLTPFEQHHSINEKIKTLNDLIVEYCLMENKEFSDVYLAVSDLEGCLKTEYSDDGVHLTASGYEKTAEAIYQTIISLYKKKL